MLNELKEFIDLNKCEQKFQWWVYLLIKVGAVVGMFTLLALCSCSTVKKVETQTITERDTIYIDRVVEIEKLVRDTIISKDTIIEYSLDTLGNWQPTKKIVGSGLKIGTLTEQSVEQTKEDATFHKHTDIITETKEKKPNVWAWFAWGAFACFAGLFIIRFIISRI